MLICMLEMLLEVSGRKLKKLSNKVILIYGATTYFLFIRRSVMDDILIIASSMIGLLLSYIMICKIIKYLDERTKWNH